ncbi:MAG: LicD family protein [Bacteroidales bacterium]|nr:LicD family protein [Bacteroidales bacterium]
MRLSYQTDYALRDLQLRLVPLIKCIDQVCREHGLRYYLWAGTMLGAVRHKGFIPWDDDADLAMPRPDYDILMAHAHEWLPQPYEIVGPHQSLHCPHRFAKIIDASTTLLERPDFLFPEGIYVDIFPIDGFTDDEAERRRILSRYKKLKKRHFFCFRDPYKHGGGPRAWFGLLFQKIFKADQVQGQIQDLMRTYDYDKCHTAIEYDFGTRAILPKQLLGEPKLYEFEGEQFYGVADADAVLTAIYGDYMTLPPVEQRAQHKFYYLDFNMPYRDFVRNGGLDKYSLKH